MLSPVNSRYAVQKVAFGALLLSFLLLSFLVTSVSPIGQVWYFIGGNVLLFVFLSSMIYNIYELYVSFFKKEILTIEQSYRAVIASALYSINLIGLLVMSQTNNLSTFTIFITFLIFIIIYLYGNQS
jgi:hypothetical protein